MKRLSRNDGTANTKLGREERKHVPQTPSAFNEEMTSTRPFSCRVNADDTTAAAPVIFPSSPKLAAHSVASGLLGCTKPRSGKAERMS